MLKGVQKTKYSRALIKNVEKMRSRGASYSLITAKYGIAKSTLSYWLSRKYATIFDREKQLEHLKRARVLSNIALEKRGVEERKFISGQIKKEIDKININDIGLQKMALAMLYWAEGSKHRRVSGLIFTNTDPAMISMYSKLLVNTYKIDKSRFTISLHLHYYHKIKETRQFWQNILQIASEQFKPIFIKKRSRTKRFRKNFYGICCIRYPSSKIRKELLELGKQFGEKIK